MILFTEKLENELKMINLTLQEWGIIISLIIGITGAFTGILSLVFRYRDSKRLEEKHERDKPIIKIAKILFRDVKIGEGMTDREYANAVMMGEFNDIIDNIIKELTVNITNKGDVPAYLLKVEAWFHKANNFMPKVKTKPDLKLKIEPRDTEPLKICLGFVNKEVYNKCLGKLPTEFKVKFIFSHDEIEETIPVGYNHSKKTTQ